MIRLLPILFLTWLLAVGVGAEPAHIPTLLDYSKQLKLTQAQVDKVKAALGAFQKSAHDLTVEIQFAQKDLNAALERRADLEREIKPRLGTLYGLKARLHYADLVVARQIEAALTPEQLKQWQAMQAKARKAGSS